jgi:hypothetical protein
VRIASYRDTLDATVAADNRDGRHRGLDLLAEYETDLPRARRDDTIRRWIRADEHGVRVCYATRRHDDHSGEEHGESRAPRRTH